VRQELLLRNLKKCRENKENEKKHAEKETVTRPKRVQPMLFVGDKRPSSSPEKRTVRLAYLGT
jgi:hypothetical protein